jgi:hypothetical protein
MPPEDRSIVLNDIHGAALQLRAKTDDPIILKGLGDIMSMARYEVDTRPSPPVA